jgi:hypothetical protein
MMNVAMPYRAGLDGDLSRLVADATELADENDRLRMINAEMLAALQSALPILQEALPAIIHLDSAKEVVVKVQAAIGKAAADS